MEAAAAAAAALTVRCTSRCLAASAPAAHHGYRRQRAAASSVLGRSRSRRRAPCGRRLRALPPELSEFLNPKLVPGSPSDTGDVSSLIPVSAVMLLLYLVTNWIVPELVMKKLRPTAEEEAAAAASSSSSMSSAQQGEGSGKVKKKRRKKKSGKETLNV